jgi:hypothetical protein
MAEMAETRRQAQIEFVGLLTPHAGGEELHSSGDLFMLRRRRWRQSYENVLVANTDQRLIIVTLDKKAIRRNDYIATGAEVHTTSELLGWETTPRPGTGLIDTVVRGSAPYGGHLSSTTIRTASGRLVFQPAMLTVHPFLRKNCPMIGTTKMLAAQGVEPPMVEPERPVIEPGRSASVPVDKQQIVARGKRSGWIIFAVVLLVVAAANAAVFLSMR